MNISTTKNILVAIGKNTSTISDIVNGSDFKDSITKMKSFVSNFRRQKWSQQQLSMLNDVNECCNVLTCSTATAIAAAVKNVQRLKTGSRIWNCTTTTATSAAGQYAQRQWWCRQWSQISNVSDVSSISSKNWTTKMMVVVFTLLTSIWNGVCQHRWNAILRWRQWSEQFNEHDHNGSACECPMTTGQRKRLEIRHANNDNTGDLICSTSVTTTPVTTTAWVRNVHRHQSSTLLREKINTALDALRVDCETRLSHPPSQRI